MAFIASIVSPTGEINLTIDGVPYVLGHDHPSYSEVKDALSEASAEDMQDEAFAGYLLDQIDIAKSVNAYVNSEASDIVNAEVKDGQVFVNGKPLHNTLTNRILDLKAQGFRYAPMLRFLENLEQNPSFNSRDQLMNFLEHVGLPITEDGHFMAYKSVRVDFRDHHSGSYDNTPGAINEMSRSNVDDNPNNHCSFGFHVGTMNYARGFHAGSPIVLCKVNPRDAVSVPQDHNAEKLRVCRYEVVQQIDAVLVDAVYAD